jgi:hypothetical protein
MKTFFSITTFLFSTLALLFSGFTAYKVFTLDQELDAFRSASAQAPPTSAPPASGDASASAGSNAIQPGQMIQPALNDEAKVELLAVKRIKDPRTGTRDVVNVQFRVRRLTPDNSNGYIRSREIKAMNPETNEVYKVMSESSDSSISDTVFLSDMSRGGSADAHAWLNVPEGVNTLDIYVPKTQTFKNVPIS